MEGEELGPEEGGGRRVERVGCRRDAPRHNGEN